jgi:hypothetical protein
MNLGNRYRTALVDQGHRDNITKLSMQMAWLIMGQQPWIKSSTTLNSELSTSNLPSWFKVADFDFKNEYSQIRMGSDRESSGSTSSAWIILNWDSKLVVSGSNEIHKLDFYRMKECLRKGKHSPYLQTLQKSC